MKKSSFIVITVLIMLITSRFIIRLVDATVQIDADIGLLTILLILLNISIGIISYLLYKRHHEAGNPE